jgi:hypothetical protein
MAKQSITYKKLSDGTWGAWIPSHFGDVVIGEEICVSRRDRTKNHHAVHSIVTTYASGTVVRIMDIEQAAPVAVIDAEVALKKSTSKSNIFKVAHKLTKATVKAGDSYQATFAICLKLVMSIAKSIKTSAIKQAAKRSQVSRAQMYDNIMNEGYSDAGNLNPYRKYA